MKPIFLGRKERRNSQMRGNHPHTLANNLPDSELLPSLLGSRPRVTNVTAVGAGCTLAHCLSTAQCNEKQMAMIPCAHCVSPHTPQRQGLLRAASEAICFSFYRQRKATEEGGREAIVFRVSGELMQE